MTEFAKFLLPCEWSNKCISASLLILRLIFCGMMMIHGWSKLINFNIMSEGFLGGAFGLSLVVFAEFFCAFAVAIGLLHRLALIPLIVDMAIAFIVVHRAQLTGQGNGEMALLYLAVFVALIISGPGRFSVDYFVFCPPSGRNKIRR